MVSQVGTFDSRWGLADEENCKLTYDGTAKRARGELGKTEPRLKAVSNLIGTPIRDKLIQYLLNDEAA